jgi:hypothetical protein
VFEAFRVGPVDTGEGTFTLYMASSAAGAVSAIASDDRAERGIDVRWLEDGREGLYLTEVLGELTLTFSGKLPAEFAPAPARSRRRSSPRRASSPPRSRSAPRRS